MDGYHEYAGGPGISLQATRVDDKVTLSFYRDNELLVQIDTSKAGAMGIVQQILGVLK
jgi:hypothetical protein